MPALINDKIQHATFVRASPERVYDDMATAHGLDGWFTAGARVDARPGGETRFRWQEWGPDKISGEDGGSVLQAKRPERFVFQWRPDNATYATTVEINFEPTAGGTIIRLHEHGYHDTVSGLRAMLNCAAGWGEALTLLKVHVEHDIRY